MIAPRADLAATELLVDGHVHLHPISTPAAFLGAAAAHFDDAASALGWQDRRPAALLLAEMPTERAFERLRAHRDDGWTVEELEPGLALRCRDREGHELIVVAGQQIVTAEGVEVLALAAAERFPDAKPLDRTIDAVASADRPVLLPWGVGKWTGARAGLIEHAVTGERRRGLLVGDNGGRLRGTSRPRLLDRAEAHGHPCLCGSDPLPLPTDALRCGSFGSRLVVSLDPARPGSSVRGALMALKPSPPSFGRLQAPLGFVRNQATMQLRKRLRRS